MFFDLSTILNSTHINHINWLTNQDHSFLSKTNMFNLNEQPHQRYDPLIGDWILVSPQRAQRPWLGQIEDTTITMEKTVVPRIGNALEPGGTRSNNVINPEYRGTYVFPNDHPALVPLPFAVPPSTDPLFQYASAEGTCRVMCYHPDPKEHISTLPLPNIIEIIEEWYRQTLELGTTYEWVQIFENRGEQMGASNPHPHCQIWATKFLPNLPKRKYHNQFEYYKTHRVPLLEVYTRRELELKDRIVCENAEWLVVVPFWALWPFETMVLPKKPGTKGFCDLDRVQIELLAEILKVLIGRYDRLFGCRFPYSMGWFGAPSGAQYVPESWTFHGTFYPPLLRSSSVRKFMVGYELFAQGQRDFTPERAASELRSIRI